MDKIMVANKKKFVVVLCANTSWYIYNFRRNTIKAFIREGHQVIVVWVASDPSSVVVLEVTESLLFLLALSEKLSSLDWAVVLAAFEGYSGVGLIAIRALDYDFIALGFQMLFKLYPELYLFTLRARDALLGTVLS